MKPNDIIQAVAKHYSLTPTDLTGKSRLQYITLARHIAMYLIRKELNQPFLTIAKDFGTTHYVPMYAVEKIQDWVSIYPEISATISTIKQSLPLHELA